MLDNDTDVDEDALAAVLVDDVSHGTLSLAADGVGDLGVEEVERLQAGQALEMHQSRVLDRGFSKEERQQV